MPRKVELYGARGEHVVLACATDSDIILRPDSGLWGLPTHAIAGRPLVGAAGEAIESVRAEARTFSVPVLLDGDSPDHLDGLISSLGSMLDPDRDVRVVFNRADGTRREITARYLSGGEALAVKYEKHLKVTVPLVFRAFHPYWRSGLGIREETNVFADALTRDYNFIQFDNFGDVETWPEITVTGPVENIECANMATGQVFRIVRVLPLGETVRIDTDPRTFGVYLNNAEAYSIVIDPFSEFWPLVPGLNRLIFSGITSGSTNPGRWWIRWREEYTTC